MKKQAALVLFFLVVGVAGLALWTTREGATAEKISIPSNTWVRVKTTGDGSASQYGMAGLPRFRGWQQASFDLETREVVIFGGSSSTYMSDTWTFNLNEKVWHIRRPHPDLVGPCRRDNHNLVYDPVGKVHWLFNGISYDNLQPGCARGATWIYDRAKNQWSKISVSGDRSHRLSPGIAYNPDRREFLQFGGGAVNLSDTTLRFDIADRRWHLIRTNPSPPPRTNIEGGLVYDRAHKLFVLFGGKGNKGVLNDTWTFDPATDKWQRKSPPVSPSPRDIHAMVYDEAREKVILFGGRGGGKLNDTWIYDTDKDTWTKLQNTGNPPSLFFHSAVYDPFHDVIIVVDGQETLVFRYDPQSAEAGSRKAKAPSETRSSPESMSEKSGAITLPDTFAAIGSREILMTKVVDRDSDASLLQAGTARSLPLRGKSPGPAIRLVRAENSDRRPARVDERGAVALGSAGAAGSDGLSPSVIDIPPGQWKALPVPAVGKGVGGISKHVTGAFNPNNQRLYFTGGDYSGSGGYMQSYRQETWSLSVAERFSSSDPNAGWKLEFPYCGPAGGVQPYHPDFVGWTWDSTRNVFWMVPGTMVASSSNCPDEPGSGFLGSVMTFDPVTQKWAHQGPASKYKNRTWQSVYDAKTDTIIQFAYNGGNGRAEAGIYHPTAKTWSYVGLGLNALRKDIRINDGYMAADFEGRAIYAIDPFQGRLHRYLIDSRRLEDLGAIPTGPTNKVNPQAGNLVWDSVNKILLWALDPWRGFHSYHPGSNKWEAVPSQSNVNGIKASGRTLVFDPSQNVFVLFGCNSDSCKPSAHYLFLFRYR